jgi:hypothetical protein
MSKKDKEQSYIQSEQITNNLMIDGEKDADRQARIRGLNDALRTQGRGGIIHMTNGIAALGLAKVNAIFKAIAAFDTFNADNDPHGEHDCAVMEVEGERLIWKIDYYDRSRTYHSPDPADPKVTIRVMTVMLSEEY